MDRKDRRTTDDEPIIGDFSDDHDARLRAEKRRSGASPAQSTPKRRKEPEPMFAEGRAPPRAQSDSWRHDPTDMRRQKQRMKKRERSGVYSKVWRYALAAALVAAVVVGYRNADAVRAVGIEAVARIVRTLAERSTGGDAGTPANGEPETVVVESGEVAGTRMPSAIGGAPATEEAAAPIAAAPTPAEPPAASAVVPTEVPQPAVDAREAVVAAAPPAPEPVPEAPPRPPPGPETFELAAVVVNVSEAAAGARVLVLRSGDRSQASTIVWSTREGTATAGSDYIDRGAVVERFAPGEQNRTLQVPIVGDRNAEGPENFYVVLVSDEGEAAGDVREAEVVIDDDD